MRTDPAFPSSAAGGKRFPVIFLDGAPMKKFLACFAAIVLAAAAARRPADAQTAVPGGIADFFRSADGLVRDTNADGIADAVAARVILPAGPALEDVQAAAEIACRLGFETSALTLPVVLTDDDVARPAEIALPILVGRTNRFVRKLVAEGAADIRSLTKGQGLIARVRSPLGGGDGLVIAGADDEGTLAAAHVLAARLPRVWAMSGVKLSGIEEQVVRLLRAQSIDVSGASIDSLIVDSDRRGIRTVHVRLQTSIAAAPRALQLLADLDLAHRRGMEPRSLNFASIAATVIEAATPAGRAGTVEVRRSGMNPRTLTPPIDPDELAPDSPGERGRPAETVQAPAKPFDLSNAYSIDGWFGDSYADLIPDRTDTSIVIGEPRESLGAAHIAARLGLESTGITLPIVKPDGKVRGPEREPSPILVGAANALVRALAKIGKTRLDDLGPGDGMIHLVPRAFGNATATVVAGGDPAGTDAACLYLARRLPYLWEVERGAFSLDDLKTQAGRFFQARSAAGQAALALGEIDSLQAELADKKPESVEIRLFLESADGALDRFLEERLKARLPEARIQVASRAITEPVPVFEEKIEIPWEVDEFWSRLRAEVLPRVRPGSRVDLEARLSESPAVRSTIAARARAELLQAGAAEARVRILSAYKQGFLWLAEEVVPELKGRRVRSIHMRIATCAPDLTKKFKFYTVPTRWLHELYPIDEVFERELGVPREAWTLELVDGQEETYRFEAFDAAGRVVYRTAFSPKFVEREYMDKFPGWSRVQVTTGWLKAEVDGRTVSNGRIATDPERFWDFYQGKVLPRVHEHVMKVADNKPMPDKQPFFRDLDVEVWMSEPDFRLGIDEEQISSLEALHEDLYFVTLDFFDALGRTTVRRRLSAPGKILPIIHPDRPGRPGEARILYAGNAASKARIEISYREKGAEKPVHIARDLAKIDVSAPSAVRIVVRADRVKEIELAVEARDDREAARCADALETLARLHAAGLYRTSLSYDHVDRIAVAIALKDARTRRTLAHTGAAPPSNIRSASGAPPHPLVPRDHIIGPEESEQIAARLAAYPEVKTYKAGTSYRGREISIMEITAPAGGELVSLAKLTALKPTIFITGRQHANEVSSTSHILRLAELLVTDPSYKEILKKVNVILQPVENPDGAAMAYELQKLTPTHMLHAGRYSALGMDVGSQVGQADPLLPEALVRGRVWREWLPDIYLNPHGYPSHEWVQQFAGYVPPGFRSYLMSRGWYTNVSGLRDPRFPAHAQVIEAIREAIVQETNADPEVRAMNRRHQERYRRWAYGFQPYVNPQEIYKEATIYHGDPETGEPSGSRRARDGGGRTMSGWPQVTYFNGMTEAPDETAQGSWLDLVTRPGFAYLMASIKYLRDGQYQVHRIEEEGRRDSVTLTTLRPRPVLPRK